LSSSVESHEKKRRDVKQIMSITDTSFNLNKARHEVRQLGIKGMSDESKEDAVLRKLIQLGAKVHDHTLYFVSLILVPNWRSSQKSRKIASARSHAYLSHPWLIFCMSQETYIELCDLKHFFSVCFILFFILELFCIGYKMLHNIVYW